MSAWFRITGVLAILTLAGLAVLRIADTYRVFNHTYDEPAHIAAGMEWLDRGQYTYEYKHPPMRAVYAIGPWLLGAHSFGEKDWYDEGYRILYESDDYKRTLTAARIAALPFFLLALGVVGLWATRIGGAIAGVLAVFAYSMLPLALAHGGLATNDTLVTGTLTLALYALACWLERPSRGHAAFVGAATAFAVLSKLSALPFFGLSAALSFAIWLLGAGRRAFNGRLRSAARGALWATLVGLTVMWAGYRFSLSPIANPELRPYEAIDERLGSAGTLHDLAYALAELPIPLSEFFLGVRELLAHNARGHTSYFMGSVIERGTAAYFPVGVLIKTPIPFLLLGFCGLGYVTVLGWRRRRPLLWLPGLSVLAIFASCIPSSLNIGIRHILPIFPLIAITAGAGAAKLWESGRGRWLARACVLALLGWLAIASLRAHPDYLAYFNECCDAHPERWLVNTDLDWGQDLDRLADVLRRRKVERLHLAYFGRADPHRHGLPPFDLLPPYTPVSGWVAISEFNIALGTRVAPYDQYHWLEAYQPVEHGGRSMRLYLLP